MLDHTRDPKPSSTVTASTTLPHSPLATARRAVALLLAVAALLTGAAIPAAAEDLDELVTLTEAELTEEIGAALSELTEELAVGAPVLPGLPGFTDTTTVRFQRATLERAVSVAHARFDREVRAMVTRRDELKEQREEEARIAAEEAERQKREAAAKAERERREAAEREAAAKAERERREAAEREAAAKAERERKAAQPPSNAGVWDRLAQCESGGDWTINTGNGYYGGLQFSLSSWQWVGGSGYPHQASKATQIEMAERLKSRQGWGAWPACSRKLGLR